MEVTEPGGWGPWVDGGGWLAIEDHRVDWIYRDVDRVHRLWQQCQAGRFEIGAQPGHPLGVLLRRSPCRHKTMQGCRPSVAALGSATRRVTYLWERSQLEATMVGPGPKRDSVLELRLHGTGGEPPEKTLDCHSADELPGGDKLTALFEPHGARPHDHSLEAYSWRKLTSGAASRAFWLLLLPFILINLSFWARPRERLSPSGTQKDTRDPSCSSFDFLVRVLALSLTAQMVVAAAAVGPNLVGWQCAGEDRRCGARLSFLGFMSMPLPDSWWEQPGRRLVVTALVPLLTLFVLVLLARKSWQRYESTKVPEAEGSGGGGALHPLSHQDFWDGKHLVERLRTLHLAVGCTVVSAVLTYPALREDVSIRGHVPGYLGWVLLGADGLLALAILVALACPAITSRQEGKPGLKRTMRGLFLLGPGLLVLTGVYVSWHRPAWQTTVSSEEFNEASLPGYQGFVTGLVATQVIALVALAIAAQRMRSTDVAGARSDAALNGWGTPVAAAALSLFLGGAYSAGATYGVAELLERNGQDIRVPDIYAWLAAGFVAEFVFLILMIVVRLFRARILRREMRAQVNADFPGIQRKPRRQLDIVKAYTSASMTRLAPWALILAALPALILFVSPIEVFLNPTKPSNAFQLLGSVLAGVFAVALSILGLMAYRSERWRRLVGNLWDVGTFWPRSAHPLAPPCYAERVVPDITRRTNWWCEEKTPGGVILSGHSQGSVIVVATFLQVPLTHRSRLRLVTYGSPLRRLYTRFFPAYFSARQLRDHVLGQMAGSHPWRNLWRRTDPVTQALDVNDTVDCRLLDPKQWDVQPDALTFSAIEKHSKYREAEEYIQYIKMSVDALKSFN
ncbi:hypothetical protein AR457_38170 [Streptomyces agglomeratus]|nr:hypothetical protein AR457_38170 [Streptomyces agglomeratus]